MRTEIGEHSLRIRFKDADGNEIISGDGIVTFNEPPAGITEIESGTVLVFDLPLEHPGRYHFDIQVDEDITAVVPMTVSQTPPSSPGPAGV